MTATARDLHGPAQSRAIRDLLQSLFAAELVRPSKVLWLYFAWVTDLDILDNSGRQFAALVPDWPAAPIRLTRVLEALLAQGARINVVLREHGHNDAFLSRLRALKAGHGDRIKWAVAKDFHVKGLLGDDYFLSGSMNLTINGVTVNGEHVVLRRDPSVIAEQAIELDARWGSLLA